MVVQHLTLCPGCVADVFGDPATYGRHHRDVTANSYYELQRSIDTSIRRFNGIRPGRHRATRDSTLTMDVLPGLLDVETLRRATHVRADRRVTA